MRLNQVTKAIATVAPAGVPADTSRVAFVIQLFAAWLTFVFDVAMVVILVISRNGLSICNGTFAPLVAAVVVFTKLWSTVYLNCNIP
jgi:hypothetical protein